MAIGPVQLLVLGFEHPDFHGEVIEELERLRESDTVRVIDALAVYKDAEGAIEVMHLSNLSRAEAIELGSKVGALIGLGIEGEEGLEAGAEAGAEAAVDRPWKRDFGELATRPTVASSSSRSGPETPMSRTPSHRATSRRVAIGGAARGTDRRHPRDGEDCLGRESPRAMTATHHNETTLSLTSRLATTVANKRTREALPPR